MNKVIVTKEEIAEMGPVTGSPLQTEAKIKPAIPFSVKAVLSPFVIALPVLCFLAAILKIALRNQPPRTREAWMAFLSTLLIISGLLSTVAAVGMMTFAPAPLGSSSGLAELDERLTFPELPSINALDGEAVSLQLKPLVVVISPLGRQWFGRQVRSNSFGAGALIAADSKGYLFVTARHVVPTNGRLGLPVLVAGRSGEWGTAELAGYHLQQDLALIWMARHSGNSQFVQPLASPNDGESIFVIGHPEGLRFSLSSGIISRRQPGILQISAAVSPGNSGGPVYDRHGNLAGIVSSVMDKTTNPNAENLNFAVASDFLLNGSAWELTQRGGEYLNKISRVQP